MEAPLLAHAWGAWLAIAVLWVAGLHRPFALWWSAVALGGLWQAFNYERGVYGTTALREVTWRVLIGAVVALPVLLG